MELKLWWSDKIARNRVDEFRNFAQQMANRLIQGQARYGDPTPSQNYMTRLGKEFQAYKKTGNREQLINIANYCFLEGLCPEHKKYHFDSTVDSVTRK